MLGYVIRYSLSDYEDNNKKQSPEENTKRHSNRHRY